MKNICPKFTILLLLINFSLSSSSFSQYYSSRHLTRGADTAEIYLSCQWYGDPNYITWNGIFHSTDNGQTLSVQRKTNFMVESGTIFGDSATGVLYQIPFIGQDTFGISFDYGVTFEKRFFNDIYEKAAGCMAGELYINGWELYHGTNYGNNFTLQSNFDSLRLQDVGTLPGELYWLKSPVRNPLKLAYSNDFGQTYSIHDVILPGISTMFDDYAIHRGTEPGEIYFVIWPDHSGFKIFHSFDFGQTITFQSFVDTTSGEIFYTAGRTPGTFYYVRREICGFLPCFYSCIWIYFSRDYGVTFNTYYHNLDSTLTGITRKDIHQELKVFPNPAANKVTFRPSGSLPEGDVQINIYDFFGNKVAEAILSKGQPEITLDIRNVAPGVCYYETTQKQRRQTGKLVILR